MTKNEYLYSVSNTSNTTGTGANPYVLKGSSPALPAEYNWSQESVYELAPRRGRFQFPTGWLDFIADEVYVVLRAEEPETPVLMTYKHERAFDFNGETYIIQNDDLIALATIEDAIKFAKNT